MKYIKREDDLVSWDHERKYHPWGWILKCGEFYSCGPYGHNHVAFLILNEIYNYNDFEFEYEDSGRCLDDEGAIHCERGQYLLPTLGYRPTERQKKVLLDWCADNEVEYKERESRRVA